MRRNDREVKDRDEIEDMIRLCRVCHVAMADDGIPYVVPMNFGYRFLDGVKLELYFHSAFEGRKMDILKKNNRVCFEMSIEGESVFPENPCRSGYYFSSVIGHGEVMFITDASEKCEALSILMKHQTGREAAFTPEESRTVCVYKIVSSDYIGKRKPKPNV